MDPVVNMACVDMMLRQTPTIVLAISGGKVGITLIFLSTLSTKYD